MAIVTITETAAARIVAMAQKLPEQFVRLSTKVAGCSGFLYQLDFVEKPGVHDERVEHMGAVLYIDPSSLMHLLGTRIDWMDTGLERKFVFENPMAVSHCGCGESFSIK